LIHFILCALVLESAATDALKKWVSEHVPRDVSGPQWHLQGPGISGKKHSRNFNKSGTEFTGPAIKVPQPRVTVEQNLTNYTTKLHLITPYFM